MNALLYALANLARLRWLGAAFCALAIVCTTANANAIAPGTEHEQAKTRVGGFEQNPVLNVCANALASVETHRGISNAQCETASAFSHAAEGLATSPNAAVFWSGLGPEGESLAASWASTNSGLTLEMTMAERGIVLPAWDAANPASVEAWRTAAAEFASGASGSVRVLQGDFVGSSSIWASVEFPTLVQNPAVTSITAVNPMTSWETSLWTR